MSADAGAWVVLLVRLEALAGAIRGRSWPEVEREYDRCLRAATKGAELAGQVVSSDARAAAAAVGLQVVHVLAAGRALCGLQGVPAEWPDGHGWVEAPEEATCAACVATATELAARATTEAPVVLCTKGAEVHEETAGGLTACGLAITYAWTSFRVRPGAEVAAPTCARCRRVRERAAAYLAATGAR